MTAGNLRECVLDASVGIKLFIAEELSDEAHTMFAQMNHDPAGRVFVPDLFYIECTNILWKYVKRMGLQAQQAMIYVEQIGQLALIAIPTATLTGDALDIAMTADLTAYDAAYVALAQQLDLPLITADARLVRSLAGSPHDVRWLGSVVDSSA